MSSWQCPSQPSETDSIIFFTSSRNKANLGTYELGVSSGYLARLQQSQFSNLYHTSTPTQSRTPSSSQEQHCLFVSAFLHHLSFPSQLQLHTFTAFVHAELCKKLTAGPGMAAEKRTIGMGMDYSPSSKAAARWAVDNLLKAGDRIILVHVLPKGVDASHKELWKSSGSPLIPLPEFMEMNVQARYGLNPDKEILEILQAASKSKQVEVLAKIYWGDAREKLCEAVDDLKVDSFVLGCRGLGPLKRALLGSVSNYVVNNATCPVTVVRGPSGSSA